MPSVTTGTAGSESDQCISVHQPGHDRPIIDCQWIKKKIGNDIKYLVRDAAARGIQVYLAYCQ